MLFVVPLIGGVVPTAANAESDDATKFNPLPMTRVEVFALGAAETRIVPVAGKAGVPATGAKAVMLNVSATQASGASYLTVWEGGTRPIVSNLHAVAGESVTNAMIVPLAADGSISIYNSAGSLTVTASVEGYFTLDQSGAGGFVPLTPARILNTEYSTPIPANGSRDVKVTEIAGVAAGARSVFTNLTAVLPTSTGDLAVSARGATHPNGAVLFSPGTSVSNGVAITPDASGYVTIYNRSSAVIHIILDAQGYFTSDTEIGDTFTPSTARVYDSRDVGTRLAADGVLELSLDDKGGLPNGLMTSVFANVMVFNPATTGTLKVWSSTDAEPALSSVIFHKDENRASMVATRVSDPGSKIKIKNLSAGAVDIVVDVQGWFMPVMADIPSTPEEPAGDPTKPAVVRGKLTQPDGRPASGFTVKVYPQLDTTAEDVYVDLDPLATVTTGPDGSWSATLPALAGAALAASQANGGVLNVEAVAEGSSSDGRPFSANLSVPAAIPTTGSLTEQMASVQADTEVKAAAFVPLPRANEVVAVPPAGIDNKDAATTDSPAPEVPDSMANSFISSSKLQPTAVNGYLIGGVDYSTATVTPAEGDYAGPSAARTSNAPAGFTLPSAAAGIGECGPTNKGQYRGVIVDKPHRYNAMMESHAYWDATAMMGYKYTANTESTVGVSVNLMDTWKIGGKVVVGNNFGKNVFANNPSRFGRTLKLPTRWHHWTVYRCTYMGYPEPDLTYQWRYHHDTIKPAYIDPVNGGPAFKYGQDATGGDGYARYQALPYKEGYPQGGGLTLDIGRQRTQSGESTAFGFLAGLGTGRSSNRYQGLAAGRSTARLHWVMSHYDLNGSEAGIKVFYSY